ncbi:conserved hypothetical protein [Candidatus Sulfotelmatomonas gaucii]|uniref:Uncharacterized protein n=1 Tax=Candidatus Sulfuritelmatomonas gaucii TaxID=2043161 RepID=A0A2N9M0R1_9BACT|nr:conserved hypothetical protein [Candidatus Sulfotelmatomonas gaucii]
MPTLDSNLLRIDCPCTKRNCPRHGSCEACREYHRKAKPPMLPYCEREPNWVQKLLGKKRLRAR